MELDLRSGLFLCPVFYDGDPCGANGMPLPLDAPDRALHFTEHAAKMQASGSALICLDKLPAALAPAREAVGGIMHFRKLTAPDGRDFLPLFLHYQAMTGIFGQNIRFGVVSFADVRERCIREQDIAGIVVGPGSLNKILPRELLMQEA